MWTMNHLFPKINRQKENDLNKIKALRIPLALFIMKMNRNEYMSVFDLTQFGRRSESQTFVSEMRFGRIRHDDSELLSASLKYWIRSRQSVEILFWRLIHTHEIYAFATCARSIIVCSIEVELRTNEAKSKVLRSHWTWFHLELWNSDIGRMVWSRKSENNPLTNQWMDDKKFRLFCRRRRRPNIGCVWHTHSVRTTRQHSSTHSSFARLDDNVWLSLFHSGLTIVAFYRRTLWQRVNCAKSIDSNENDDRRNEQLDDEVEKIVTKRNETK